jgi:hypothetical protein
MTKAFDINDNVCNDCFWNGSEYCTHNNNINDLDAAVMNTIVNTCATCLSPVNANNDHVNIEHDPQHVFDTFHRATRINGSFYIILAGVTCKVGYAGMKRHIGHVNVNVDKSTAYITSGSVYCGANKGALNKTHSYSFTLPVNCEKCEKQYNGGHAKATNILTADMSFKAEYNSYPTPQQKHATLTDAECDNKYCRVHKHY